MIELEAKDITKEEFTELAKTLKDLNHDIQLLSGGKTENIGLNELVVEVQK